MLADVDASSPDSGLDAVIPSDQFVPEPQGCRVGESAAVLTKPNSARVQVLYAGFESILLWADEDGVHRCDIDRNGAFVGEHRIIQTVVDGMVPTLSTLRVGPFTYVALSYDDEANPIQILRLDRSEVDSIPLINDVDRLSGAAKLTTVEGVLVVFGRTESGAIGWATLENPWSAPEITITSAFEGLFPDDVIAVPSGAFLRFSESGQCAFFDGTQRDLVSSIPCSLGKGGLVGNGESARIWQLKTRRVRVVRIVGVSL